MWFKHLSVALGVALGLAASVALAQKAPVDPGFYVGGAVGQGLVHFSDTFLAINGGGSSTLTRDETDTAWKLFAGYRIHRNIAVEGGYTDFGQFSATRRLNSGSGSASESLKIKGWHLQAVGLLPLRNFDLFAKAGGVYATVEAQKSVSGSVSFVPGTDTHPKTSSLAFLGGIGAAYNFTKNFSIRTELEVTSDVGNDSTGKGSVAMISVGGAYKF
jgi:OOP family OmpA-OmpF porin